MLLCSTHNISLTKHASHDLLTHRFSVESHRIAFPEDTPSKTPEHGFIEHPTGDAPVVVDPAPCEERLRAGATVSELAMDEDDNDSDHVNAMMHRHRQQQQQEMNSQSQHQLQQNEHVPLVGLVPGSHSPLHGSQGHLAE